MSEPFHSIFQRATSTPKCAKFLSRVFGIFSEEIVSLWAGDDRAPYESLGRPTIKAPGEYRGHTLDFTLRERTTGKLFVAEMKCEIEFQSFKYFILESAEQLSHHTKPAFDVFLKMAKPSPDHTVFLARRAINIDGAILIWGSATREGRKAVIQSKGLHDVLTIAEICHDLSSWNHTDYRKLVADRQEWCNELFSGLLQIHGNAELGAIQASAVSVVG